MMKEKRNRRFFVSTAKTTTFLLDRGNLCSTPFTITGLIFADASSTTACSCTTFESDRMTSYTVSFRHLPLIS
jgi:hypothetical protein